MGKLRLSYSAITNYEQCPRKYYLHYVEKIRPKQIDSPLFFGNAIDEALGHLLLEKKVNATEEELELSLFKDAKTIFIEHFTNSRDSYLPDNPHCSYFQSDFDAELLEDEDWKVLFDYDKEIFDFTKFFEECKAIFKQRGVLTEKDQRVFNYMCWLSLKRKGIMLIEAYKKEILPKIDKVYHIQKDIELFNDTGDVIVGKIDFIGSFVDEPDIIYICDNKTSSKAYKEDSVKTSDQLAIYCEAEGNYNASYLVVEKKLRIREPRVRTQLIKDKINDDEVQKTFDKCLNVLHNVADGHFPMKDNEKDCNFFGKRCPYYNFCWKNGDMNGLSKKEDK